MSNFKKLKKGSIIKDRDFGVIMILKITKKERDYLDAYHFSPRKKVIENNTFSDNHIKEIIYE